jgi:class 3 adenylate cyclase/tetratricopeptide (TPR) repeat protein
MAESRKVVTIVFADVTGSTALGEQLDPEAMRRIMERYFAEMRTVLERHGGTVEKFIGDAVMAVFGIPAVHEDDALRAVRVAAAMRERLAALNEELGARGATISVRTGVNTGEVVAGDPSAGQAFATGDAVNVAARLEQAAEPSEILLGPLTHELVRDAVRTGPVEALELKGKSEPVEARRLFEVLPDVPAYTRRIDTPFVGREKELAALRAAYERARAEGTCELVTVTGVPGIGKSRLVRELVGSLGDESRVLVGRCLSYGEGITYWPLAEIVREVAGADPRPGLTDLLASEPDGALVTERLLTAIGATDEDARTEEIFWATRILLERLARDHPLLVVVDDVHWAEPTLLDPLEYLAGFSRAPLLLACTARPDLFDVRPQWPRTRLVELQALDADDSDALIDALLAGSDVGQDVREQIRERAEGNPLFVEQMLALAAENGSGEIAVPATIQALLSARLDHLPTEEHAVLVRGAVEGRLFHRGVVSALVPEDERDEVPGRLLTLARKSFVRPDESLFPGDDAFRFVHALVRDAAYESAPKELRAELHERFADWLELRASDRVSELDEIIGYHLEQAWRYRQALGESADDLARRAGDDLAVAGERAARRGDRGATVNLLERVLALLPEDDGRRFELMLTLGAALFESGRFEDAEQLLRATIAEASRRGLESVAFTAEIEISRLEIHTHPEWSADDALALVERALPVLEAAGDHLGLARALRLRWNAEWMQGRLSAVKEAASQALEHARRAGDTTLFAESFGTIGGSMAFGYVPISEILVFQDDLLAWARETGHRETEATVLFFRGRVALEQGRSAEGQASVAQSFAILDDLGMTLTRIGFDGDFTWGELLRQPEDVEKRARASHEALKAAGETGLFSTQAAALAFVVALRGQLDEAERLSRESEDAGSKDDVITQVLWRCARALVLARRGLLSEAEALARHAVSLATATEYAQTTAEAHIALADVFRNARRTEEAARELEEALRIYERTEYTLSAEAVREQLAELQSLPGSPSQ